MSLSKALTGLYYLVKPAIPRSLQLRMRRAMIARKRPRVANRWPILEAAGEKPDGWPGWPQGRQFAFVLTHDVDTARGQNRCRRLMEMEMALGLRSSFNFVPERYPVDRELLRLLQRNGFEVGVHGLNHDGRLFSSRRLFRERARRINHYLSAWQAEGFRAPAMHRELNWLHDLMIAYDSSTFDTDPFEPQPEGVGTIFPFWVPGPENRGGYVELPYTLPQDFTLFVLMAERTLEIWARKLSWIAACGGMALMNTHPDYMNFEFRPCAPEEYPAAYYRQWLEHVREKYHGRYFSVLPRELARYWKAHCRRPSRSFPVTEKAEIAEARP